jgi:hypothetical protein
VPHESLAANLVALWVSEGAVGCLGGLAYLLGASMRMGAEMPRYNLEALQHVNVPPRCMARAQAYPSCLMIFLKQSTMPLYASSPVALLVWSCLGGFRNSHRWWCARLTRES